MKKSKPTDLTKEEQEKLLLKALKLFPDTKSGEWKIVEQSIIHKDCFVLDKASFLGSAICRDGSFEGGTFLGGIFHDGLFYGGTFCKGTFYGGTFRKGSFYGGTFYGGNFYDGNFTGGIYERGVYNGGKHSGGIYKGGLFENGYYYGGMFNSNPILITGDCPWPVTVGSPGKVSIGCLCYSPSDWRKREKEILTENKKILYNMSVDVKVLSKKARRTIAYVEKWMKYNPDVVVPEPRNYKYERK